MKVLIVSTNRFRERFPVTPSGPAYIAGSAIESGHDVEVFDCLFSSEPKQKLAVKVDDFEPDVVAISIKLVHAVYRDAGAPFKSRHQDLRPHVMEAVETVRSRTDAPIVLGGPGFNYFGPDWLEYLDLDYGIRGEAEMSFPAYLNALEAGDDISTILGSVFRRDHRFDKAPRGHVLELDDTAMPSYELFDMHGYLDTGSPPAVLTKRGCPYRCTHCIYSELEGTRFRLKPPEKVVAELRHIGNRCGVNQFYFCDNNFNAPISHSVEICEELVRHGADIQWSAELRPGGVTEEYCRLLAEAGCVTPNLTVESGSASMLRKMHRGYGPEAVREAMKALAAAKIPFTIDLLVGGPGETPETISETFDLIDGLPSPEATYVTVGLALYPHQGVLDAARQSGQTGDEIDLFDGAYYISPELAPDYLQELLGILEARDNCFFWFHKADGVT